MIGGAFLAGSVVGKMVLDRTKWAQSVQKVKEDERSLKQFSERTTKRFQALGAAMTITGGVIVGALGSTIKAASDAEETYAKFGTVFQDVSEQAETAADNLAESYGVSSTAARDMLGATGDLLTGLGVMPGIALDLSEKTQQLAVDLASFTNYSGGAKGASEALTNAMLGERESIKSLGIVITEEMVKERLLAEGKDNLTGLAYKQAAAEATLQIAMDQSKNAIGDYARTSDSFANQQRLLKARLQDVATTLGQQLLPIATKIVNGITKVVQKVKEWTDAHPELTQRLVKIAAIVGSVMLALGPLVIALPKLVSGFSAAGKAIQGVSALMGVLKGASLAALGPVTLLTAALGALALGYMKVKKARDEANKSAQRSLDQEGKLFRKIKEATDAAGLSERQFLKLRDAYHGNAAALAMAIKRGKEGKELQDAYTKVCEKQKETVEAQTSATDDFSAALQNNLIPQIESAKEKQKDWTDYLSELGIKTLQQKQDRVDELEGYLRQLEQAYKDGKLSLEDYRTAVETTSEEIASLTETVVDTIPAAGREFDLVFTEMTSKAAEFPKAVKPAAEETATVFGETSQYIKDEWTLGLKDMLMGARSFKDVAGSIWGGIKNQFFTLVSQLISKWTLGFVAKALGGIKDVAGGLTSGIGNAAKGLGSLFGGVGGKVKDLIGGIGKLAGGLSPGGILGGAIGGLIGGLAGGMGKATKNHIKDLVQNTNNILATLRTDFRDNQFNWFLAKYDQMIEGLHGIIPRKFDAVNKRLDNVKSYAKRTAEASEALVKAIKNVTSAANGAVIDRTQLVMAHGSRRNPEIIARSDALKNIMAQQMRQQQVNIQNEQTVKMQGLMITDRDYARQRMVPEMLAALENDGRFKDRLKRILLET